MSPDRTRVPSLSVVLRAALVLCVLFSVALGACCRAADGDVRVEFAGSIRFPDAARAADGTIVTVTGLSGVTWLGNDRWAAAVDNSDQLVMFTLDLAADAAPTAVRDVRVTRLSARHDYEDIAVVPPGLPGPRVPQPGRGAGMALPWLLMCEEDTPAIHRVAATDGMLAGRIAIPDVCSRRRINRGFESLCVDVDGACVWTANEEALADDGPAAAPGAGTVVRLIRLPLPAAGAETQRTGQFAYAVDPPHAAVTLVAGRPLSGVVALVALGGGRLLVLERSAVMGLPPFENRIYLVDTSGAEDVSSIGRDLATRTASHVAKRLLWKGGLGCNFEGLGSGPPRAAITPLVAISDNGGLSAPAQLAGFRLFQPVTSP